MFTKREGIIFQKEEVNGIKAFSDSDYAGDKSSRRSTSGMVIKFSNGPVIWKSKIQKCVAMSSMEAEYVAASETGKSILWIDRLLKEIGAINYTSVPTLYVDNQSAIKLIGNSVFHERSKHIEIKYHFLRNMVEQKSCRVEYISTNMQEADLLTKALGYAKLIKCKQMIGIQ